MRGAPAIAGGAFCILLGGLWFLQGLRVIPAGSMMSGSQIWIFIGLLTAFAGLSLISAGLRARNKGQD